MFAHAQLHIHSLVQRQVCPSVWGWRFGEFKETTAYKALRTPTACGLYLRELDMDLVHFLCSRIRSWSRLLVQQLREFSWNLLKPSCSFWLKVNLTCIRNIFLYQTKILNHKQKCTMCKMAQTCHCYELLFPEQVQPLQRVWWEFEMWSFLNTLYETEK